MPGQSKAERVLDHLFRLGVIGAGVGMLTIGPALVLWPIAALTHISAIVTLDSVLAKLTVAGIAECTLCTIVVLALVLAEKH